MKGSFTVEAAILLPFIIICTFVGIYFNIFVYDRALMLQDAENICCLLLMGESPAREDITKHPYLSLSNMTLKTVVKEDEVSVIISADWKLSILPAFNRRISCSASRKRVNPVFVMFLTEDIKRYGGMYKEWINSELSGN